MKQVKLKSLKLENFKGIKQFELIAEGENVKVYGDNAAGKTTLFDAFFWLLFDKDSQNKKEFEIKTLTADGEPIHNLEHSVEGTFEVNSVPIKLKKVYKEVWTKKRGKSTAKHTGHTTDYYIDDVPIGTKKAYTERVADIVEEETFRLVTSPMYFNEHLKWQKRREILLKIAGDVTDEDVINSKEELAKLNDFLSGKSVEDMKKIVAAQMKKINDELDDIPVRMDEIRKMMPAEKIDVAALNAQLTQIESELEALQMQRHNIANGAAILEKKKQLQELDLQLGQLKNEHATNTMQEVYKLQARVQEAEGNLQIVQGKVQQAQYKIDTIQRESQALQDEKAKLENEMNELRSRWSTINSEQFEYEDKCECPTCKQALPVEQVEAARAEAEAQFNAQKSEQLTSINERGQSLKKTVTEIGERLITQSKLLDDAVKEKEAILADIAEKQKALDKAKQQLETAKSAVPDVTTTIEYQTIASQKQTLESEIQQLNEHAFEAVGGIDEQINQLNQQKKSVNMQIAQSANVEANNKRISELEARQKQLAKEYEELEQRVFLLEEFTRTKVDLLNERINSKFKYARFKMFHVQVDGGIAETCETVVDGVPFNSLNNAARINAGIDICNTLQEHFGLKATIWVDNSESITELIDVDTQVVQLIVSESDKSLRVEVDGDSLPTLNMEVV